MPRPLVAADRPTAISRLREIHAAWARAELGLAADMRRRTETRHRRARQLEPATPTA